MSVFVGVVVAVQHTTLGAIGIRVSFATTGLLLALVVAVGCNFHCLLIVI